MTRAQPGDLAPNESLSINGDVLTLGNPELSPYFADNYDLGLEWYFGESGLGVIAVNVWQKKIEGYTTILAERVCGIRLRLASTSHVAAGDADGLRPRRLRSVALHRGQSRTRARAHRPAPEYRRADHARWLGADLRAAARLPVAGRRLLGELHPHRPEVGRWSAGCAVERDHGLSPFTYNVTAFYENFGFSGRLVCSVRDAFVEFLGNNENNIAGDN